MSRDGETRSCIKMTSCWYEFSERFRSGRRRRGEQALRQALRVEGRGRVDGKVLVRGPGFIPVLGSVRERRRRSTRYTLLPMGMDR